MALYVATSCVPGAMDGATALHQLDVWGVERVQAMPGREPGKGWAAAAARFGDRLLLHHACLAAPSDPRWNLAAADADWRRRSLDEAGETLRIAADGGAAFYSLHAGWALELGLDAAGRPTGAPEPRAKALDRLAASLDRLASLADNRGLALLLENAPGRRGGEEPTQDAAVTALLQEPMEVAALFERVGAPLLGVQLDVAHWLLACRARRWEPDEALPELLPWVRAIELSGTDGHRDLHRLPREESAEVALARQAGGLSLPFILEARDLPRAELLAVVAALPDLVGAKQVSA